MRCQQLIGLHIFITPTDKQDTANKVWTISRAIFCFTIGMRRIKNHRIPAADGAFRLKKIGRFDPQTGQVISVSAARDYAARISAAAQGRM
jgi:hypothetical protein